MDMVLGLLLLCLFMRYVREHEEWVHQATCEYCDTGEALRNWRLANPNYYVGEWPYAQALVRKHLNAYERYIAAHPWIERNEQFVSWLEALINEKPQPPNPPPKSQRPTLFSRPKLRAFFFSELTKIINQIKRGSEPSIPPTVSHTYSPKPRP